jgi:FtsP/CotA-like multicopper oxidase with cupredoxin domain
MGQPTPPAPEESGWKDTAKAYPGQVLRFLIRFTPTSVPVKTNKSYAGQNLYPFDPTDGPGYVWHCHIIDHEDQDMMRPYKVSK